MPDATRRAVPRQSIGISHPCQGLSLVDDCARVIKEQGGLSCCLRPQVQIPGVPLGTIPEVLLTKLLSNVSAEQLRRFDFANTHIDTQRFWRGLCRRDFPAFSGSPCDEDWKEQYDLLVSESRAKESRINKMFKEGISFVNKRAEARKAQVATTGPTPLPESCPTMPFLQRRSHMPASFSHARLPVRRPATSTKAAGSKGYNKTESLRAAASSAQAHLLRHHRTNETAKRQKTSL